MVKLNHKTINKELVAFIENQNNFYKTTKKSLIFIVDDANDNNIKVLRNLGYKIASSSLMDVYQNNIDYFIYDVNNGLDILPKMIDLTKENNIELILSSVDTKEMVDKVREYDINYFYGEFYKKSIRMKKVIEKVS
jgi:serine kinase of HPr protein (carbohydrate metabolism regulator)